jgi:hypothetical protein
MANKSLLVLFSYHHNNTEKIAPDLGHLVSQRYKIL